MVCTHNSSLTCNASPVYCRLTWDPHNTSLVEIPNQELQSAQDSCKPWRRCVSCGLRSVHKKQASWHLLSNGGISRHGVDYHVNDFIYLVPTPSGLGFLLYQIAQIIDLIFDKDGHICQVEICHYGRYDVAVKDCSDGNDDLASTVSDNVGVILLEIQVELMYSDFQRRLFRTQNHDTIKPNAIEGKVFVAFLKSQDQRNSWIQHDDHFYVDLYLESNQLQSLEDLKILSTPIPECGFCKHKLLVKLQKEADMLHQKGPLRGLELFAGMDQLTSS